MGRSRPQPKLGDFKVLTFDCYGTLIDWESGIWDALQPLLTANHCRQVTREIALRAFSECESERERETPTAPYDEILASVHAGLASRFELDTSQELDRDFARSIDHWPAFPDTADALRSLKTRYALVILSNVHRDGFRASSRKLGVELDAVYTAEDIGSYKPSRENFDYLLDRLEKDLGLSAPDVLHTAQSLYHDHEPARALGLSNAWIDRQRLSEGGDWGATRELDERPETDFVFFSMGEMARAVEAEIG